VPVEFLSDAEAAAYGRCDGGLSREELDRVFFLDDADRELVDRRRGDHNRLGFALQLTTVRWLGAFLPDPTAVPVAVLGYVAGQLEVEDVSVVRRYLERRRTRFEHAEEIKAFEELRDFAVVSGELEEWAAARAYMTGDGPRAIFTTRSAGCATETCCFPASRRWCVWSRGRARTATSGFGTRFQRSQSCVRRGCWRGCWRSRRAPGFLILSAGAEARTIRQARACDSRYDVSLRSTGWVSTGRRCERLCPPAG